MSLNYVNSVLCFLCISHLLPSGRKYLWHTSKRWLLDLWEFRKHALWLQGNFLCVSYKRLLWLIKLWYLENATLLLMQLLGLGWNYQVCLTARITEDCMLDMASPTMDIHRSARNNCSTLVLWITFLNCVNCEIIHKVNSNYKFA